VWWFYYAVVGAAASEATTPLSEKLWQPHGMIGVIADYRVIRNYLSGLMHDSAALPSPGGGKRRQQCRKKPQPLFVMGHSAGAYNAAMLQLDDRCWRWGFEAGIFSAWIGLLPLRLYPINQFRR